MRSVWLVKDLDLGEHDPPPGLGQVRVVASTEDSAYRFVDLFQKAYTGARVEVLEVELDRDLMEDGRMRVRHRAKRGRAAEAASMKREMQEAIRSQIRLFREKFGREPGPDDPIFFDPDADTPQFCGSEATDHVTNQMVEAMSRVGMRPEVIYAFRKTGRIVTEDNWHLLSEADRKEWTDAVNEYFTRAGGAVQ